MKKQIVRVLGKLGVVFAWVMCLPVILILDVILFIAFPFLVLDKFLSDEID